MRSKKRSDDGIKPASVSAQAITSCCCKTKVVSQKDAQAKVLAKFAQILNAQPNRICPLNEIASTAAWKEHGHRLGKLKPFLRGHRIFNFELRKKAEVFVQLRIPQVPAPQQVAHMHQAEASGHVGTSVSVSTSVLVGTNDRTCPPTERARSPSTPECLSTVRLVELISSPPTDGTRLMIQPRELRWTHGTIQPLFSCGRSLTSVAQQLKRGELVATDLPIIGIVLHEGKWYSRNNRTLWCFWDAGTPAVEAVVGPVDAHFLRGLNTQTDGWIVDFFPPCICVKCRQEFPNRSGLKAHYCARVHNTSAIDWDDDASDLESEAFSEDGAYGDDGFWHPDSHWQDLLERNPGKDPLGRTPLWRAAAVGNIPLLRKLLALGAVVDALDSEGVSPLLASVRRGHYFAAEELLWAGANRQPWKFTVRKGKKWSASRAQKYDRLLAAKDAGKWLSKATLKTSKSKQAIAGSNQKRSSKPEKKKSNAK